MKIKTLIVEDEEKSRQFIRSLISDTAPFIDVAGEAKDVDEAISFIQRIQPELVLMDIELYGRSAFEIFDAIPEPHFHLVFITAFEHFAIRALRLSAVDYLLKPINPDEFRQAMERVQKRYAETLPHALKNEVHLKEEKLIVSDYKEVHILKMEEIISIVAEGNYSHIRMPGGKEIMVSKSLAEFEEALSGKRFCRTHKSYLVNMDHVSKYIKGRGGEIEMSDGSVVYVSFRKKDEFLRQLS